MRIALVSDSPGPSKNKNGSQEDKKQTHVNLHVGSAQRKISRLKDDSSNDDESVDQAGKTRRSSFRNLDKLYLEIDSIFRNHVEEDRVALAKCSDFLVKKRRVYVKYQCYESVW